MATIMSLDILFAGVDATSNLLSTVLLCLAKNPEKQAKLRQELLKIMPTKDSSLNETCLTSGLWSRRLSDIIPMAWETCGPVLQMWLFRGIMCPRAVAWSWPPMSFWRTIATIQRLINSFPNVGSGTLGLARKLQLVRLASCPLDLDLLCVLARGWWTWKWRRVLPSWSGTSNWNSIMMPVVLTEPSS